MDITFLILIHRNTMNPLYQTQYQCKYIRNPSKIMFGNNKQNLSDTLLILNHFSLYRPLNCRLRAPTIYYIIKFQLSKRRFTTGQINIYQFTTAEISTYLSIETLYHRVNMATICSIVCSIQ